MDLHSGPGISLAQFFDLTVLGVEARMEATAGDQDLRILLSQLRGSVRTFRRLLIVRERIVAQLS
jgi:hypothetical protein